MTDDDDVLSVNEIDDIIVEPKDFISNEPFKFELGGVIPSFQLRYETYGTLNEKKDNAILVFHALTGDYHVTGKHSKEDKTSGWWAHFIGPGKTIDTNKYFVIASNCLGGCRGSTGPSSINPLTGEIYGVDFPALTFGDVVHAQKRMIDAMGIKTLYAIVGGSMGGMQAMIWASEYPGTVKKVIASAFSPKQNTQAICFNTVARAAVFADPEWCGGYYARLKKTGPRLGLSLARMVGHTTYLSEYSLERKIRPGKLPEFTEKNPVSLKFLQDNAFPIDSYLYYQGSRFLDRFDANTFIYLTQAGDRFNLFEKRPMREVFQNIDAEILLIAYSSDWLYPSWQTREVHIALSQIGKKSKFFEVVSDLGHDSFLLSIPRVYQICSDFLDR